MASQVKVVRCGGSHTALLTKQGHLYTWGQGQYGALGLGDWQNQFEPRHVKSLHQSVKQVDCGKKHTLLVDESGSLFAAGDNSQKQLGIPYADRQNTFTQVLEFRQRAIDVAAGDEHSLILSTDQRLYACGNNQTGNLGLGHEFSSDSPLQVHGGLEQLKIASISAGRHSGALTEDGRLFVWGPAFPH